GLFERSAEVVDQVIAVDLDDFVVAAAGFVVKEDPGEVGVHGGHHDQGEHDQADHDHRHAGAEAGGERVGDAGANGREDAPEPGAHARDGRQDDVGVVDDDEHRGGHHDHAA